MSQSFPDCESRGVATLLCPICQTVTLIGRQTVCSAKCRIQRSMRRRAATQTERDAQLRVLLRDVLTIQDPAHFRQRLGEALALLDLEP